ncbi:hypothetical protein COU75_03240 [Candidatus Peregrinibacteria bacterium CG10_big_fil_rev_8_21_14_0_10_42_8]|nr:MAG: hypothetical protein COU75_03240 [Candidatus Peregrinibacteria bacterium CG10_big_fil_rev_8_21_14_0_10_42_8]
MVEKKLSEIDDESGINTPNKNNSVVNDLSGVARDKINKKLTLDDFSRMGIEDPSYFSDRDRILIDLQQFGSQAGQGSECGAHELSVGGSQARRQTNMLNLPVLLTAGETIDGESYLLAAAKHFEIVKKTAKTASDIALDKTLLLLKAMVTGSAIDDMLVYHKPATIKWVKSYLGQNGDDEHDVSETENSPNSKKDEAKTKPGNELVGEEILESARKSDKKKKEKKVYTPSVDSKESRNKKEELGKDKMTDQEASSPRVPTAQVSNTEEDTTNNEEDNEEPKNLAQKSSAPAWKKASSPVRRKPEETIRRMQTTHNAGSLWGHMQKQIIGDGPKKEENQTTNETIKSTPASEKKAEEKKTDPKKENTVKKEEAKEKAT